MRYIIVLKLMIMLIIISVCHAENIDDQMILGKVIQVNGQTAVIKISDRENVQIGDSVQIYYKTSSGIEMKIGEWKVIKIDNHTVHANPVDIYMSPKVGFIAKIISAPQKDKREVLAYDDNDVPVVPQDQRSHKSTVTDSQYYVDRAKKMADDLYKNSKNYSKEKIKTLWNEVIQNIQKSISMDNAEAYYALALIYEDGYGNIKRDLGKMVYNIRISADKRYVEAQYTLGEMYASGDEVVKDREQAIHWLRMAADQGHKEAKRALEKLLKKPEREIPLQMRGKEPKNFGIPDIDDLFDLEK